MPSKSLTYTKTPQKPVNLSKMVRGALAIFFAKNYVSWERSLLDEAKQIIKPLKK